MEEERGAKRLKRRRRRSVKIGSVRKEGDRTKKGDEQSPERKEEEKEKERAAMAKH